MYWFYNIALFSPPKKHVIERTSTRNSIQVSDVSVAWNFESFAFILKLKWFLSVIVMTDHDLSLAYFFPAAKWNYDYFSLVQSISYILCQVLKCPDRSWNILQCFDKFWNALACPYTLVLWYGLTCLDMDLKCPKHSCLKMSINVKNCLRMS